MKKLLLVLFLSLFLPFGVFSQCQVNIDFNTWNQEGYAANGDWQVQGGGSSVFQSINGDPTFYVSPDTFINVRINGTIRIEDNIAYDNDFVGFVFGYKEPDFINNQYDFWLFDWKREGQPKWNGSVNYYANEGFTLSRLDGIVQPGTQNYWPCFWAHDNTASCTPIATNFGGNLGWDTFTDYDFTLLYTPTRATIIVNTDTIFDEPGCYEPGRFGFYNYSQPFVRYSDFSYTLISNFEVEQSDYDQCVDIPVNFLFSDSTCIGGTSIASNINAWDWDFGNGFTSTQPNPTFTFSTTGSYQVQLIVTDVNGCQDSVTKTVVVHPPPFAAATIDSVFCPTDSVELMASGGVSYAWFPATGLSNDSISNPMAFPSVSTTYTVTVTDQFDCVDDTTVTFHVFEASVDLATTICEGDTFMLGAGGGVSYDWSPAASLNDQTLPNPLANPSVTTTYQAIVTDIYGCEDTVYQTVNVNPMPVLTVSPDTTVCENSPVVFNVSGAASYNWFDQTGTALGIGSSQSLSYSDSTTIYVIGVNLNGCANIDSIKLHVLPNPDVDPGPDQFICSYETITLGSNNNSTGTYSWSPANQLNNPSILTPTFTPANDGNFTYTLTVTDQNSCTDSAQVTVTIHPFQLTENHSDVPCFGENTGISTLTTNATAPFTYTWLDAQGDTVTQITNSIPSASSDSLIAGTYQAIIIDNFGCTDTIPVVINEPASSVSVTLDTLINVDCFGSLNGEIHVSATGGTPGYQYSIDGGFTFNSSGIFNGLGASIYTVIAQDANMCEISLSDTIKTPTGLFAQITTIKHIDCFGANNGAFSLVGQGGTAPYQYSLDNINFSNSLSVTNLAPGQDTVYFFDNNGCQVTLPFQIFEPSPLVSNISQQKGIDCFGNDNGRIWIHTAGGTGPYTFSLDGQNFQTDSTFYNLSGGLDTLIVQDDSMCQVEIPFTVNEPALLTTSIFSQQNVDCNGNSTGELIFSPNGGSPNYLFSLDSLNFQTDSTFSGLIAGNYTVTVIDDSSCMSQLTVDITEPPVLELFNDVQIDVDCYGNSTGFIGLNTLGGSVPYRFSLDSMTFQPIPNFQNLPAGNYSIWVQDDSSCVDSISVTITQPDSLELTIIDLQDIDCFGNDNGRVSIEGQGGIGPYLYGVDGTNLQADSNFTNLTPGAHTIFIQDDSMCVTQQEIDIFEPPLLEVSATHIDITCYDFNDGEATVNIHGGTAGYTILWDSPTPQTTQTATNLAPGGYFVQVTDSNGCVDSAGVNIWEPEPLILTHLEDSLIEAYCDWDNGRSAVIAEGGIEPYSYLWNGTNTRSGPSADMLYGDETYQVIVTDQNGCETILPVYIPQTPPATPIIASDPTYEDSILFAQRNVQFFNQSIGAATWFWDFGDGSTSDLENPTHLFAETGVYEVTLTVNNSYLACPTDTTVLVHIIANGSIFVPSAFSPNGDGQNDLFFPMGEGLVNYEMIIFTRWGKEIIRLNNLNDKWDGRSSKGLAMPEGVYVYRVKAFLNNGTEIDEGGTITLIR